MVSGCLRTQGRWERGLTSLGVWGSYVETHQIVPLKYAQLIVYQLHLLDAV